MWAILWTIQLDPSPLCLRWCGRAQSRFKLCFWRLKVDLPCWLTIWNSCWHMHVKEFISISPGSARKVQGMEHSSSWIQEDVWSFQTSHEIIHLPLLKWQSRSRQPAQAKWQVRQLLSVLWGYTWQGGHSVRVCWYSSTSTLMERRNGDVAQRTTSAPQESEEGLRRQDCCKGGIDKVIVVIGRFGSAAVPKSMCFLTWDDCPNNILFLISTRY